MPGCDQGSTSLAWMTPPLPKLVSIAAALCRSTTSTSWPALARKYAVAVPTIPAPRTMVFMRSTSPRVDRPDIDQRVAAHDMVAVVEVDRWVAMRRQELDQIANLQAPALRVVIDPAMLVAHQLVLGTRQLRRQHGRHAAL